MDGWMEGREGYWLAHWRWELGRGGGRGGFGARRPSSPTPKRTPCPPLARYVVLQFVPWLPSAPVQNSNTQKPWCDGPRVDQSLSSRYADDNGPAGRTEPPAPLACWLFFLLAGPAAGKARWRGTTARTRTWERDERWAEWRRCSGWQVSLACLRCLLLLLLLVVHANGPLPSAADARLQHHQDIRLVLRLLSAVRPKYKTACSTCGMAAKLLSDVQRWEEGRYHVTRRHATWYLTWLAMGSGLSGSKASLPPQPSTLHDPPSPIIPIPSLMHPGPGTETPHRSRALTGWLVRSRVLMLPRLGRAQAGGVGGKDWGKSGERGGRGCIFSKRAALRPPPSPRCSRWMPFGTPAGRDLYCA